MMSQDQVAIAKVQEAIGRLSPLLRKDNNDENFETFAQLLGSFTSLEFQEDLSSDELKILAAGLASGHAQRLTHLSFVSYAINNDAMSILSKSFATAPALKSLDLSGVSMLESAKQHLLAALREDRRLTRLRLAHCTVDGDQVVQALEGHPSLICLDMSYVPITYQSLTTLLSRFPALEFLDIRADPDAYSLHLILTCKGAAQWCEALGKNTKLTHLSLRRHKLGQRTAEYLARALKKNKALQHLDLSFNTNFGNGIFKFAEGLRHNFSLQDLLLNGCGINATSAMCLAKVLTNENRTLRRVQIAHDSFANEVIDMFLLAVKMNLGIVDVLLDSNSSNNLELQHILQRNQAYQAMKALACGFHPRLGRRSPLQLLANSSVIKMSPRTTHDLMKRVAALVYA